ncbi:MAG: ABC transporter ATP-binding protein [Alphaproteobacteria bacterium]|nr:ABC transporter ATP-binding protein [Alphaproteobacteria bacterium]
MYFDPRLWRFTAGVRDRLLWVALLGVAASAAGVARLALLGWLVARALTGAPVAELALPALLAAAAIVVRTGLEHWRTRVAQHTAAHILEHLRARLLDHLLGLGPAAVSGLRTGEATLVLNEGVEQLNTYFGQYLPQLLVALVTPIGIFAFLAWLDLPVATVLLAAALAALLLPSLLHRRSALGAVERARAYKAFAADFLDSIQGLPTLAAFGQTASRAKMLGERSADLARATMWVLSVSVATRGVTDGAIALGAAGALALGAFRVVDGAMSLEALAVVLMLGVECFRPFRDLRDMLHVGMLGQASAEAILSFLARTPAVMAMAAPDGKVRAPSVAFEDIAFTYPEGAQPALDGLTFRVDAGQRIAVVGPSGAGKSTILRLLLRFHDARRGIVRVGGEDIRKLSLEDLRRHIAIVGQDTFLFHGTVEENLRLARPDATQAEIERAAGAANADGFIQRLPRGYATVVGERGLKLSGGQRQRLAIARAILKDAPILVLDEALSSVDAENEAAIQEALDRLMAGRTTLVFAHRLSSVIGADRILVLDKGRLIESGDHAALMSLGGLYHELMAEQVRGGDRLIAGDAKAETDAPLDLAAKAMPASAEPESGILSAHGSALSALSSLWARVAPWRVGILATFGLGLGRVVAFIGVSALSALIVLHLKAGLGFDTLVMMLFAAAVAAGFLHWFESWLAHDVAYRMLAELRLGLFRKLAALGPAYLLRRRSGDLVSMATHDVELVEYFVAHTLVPAAVGVLVPAGVLIWLASMSPWLALVLAPFLAVAAASPALARRRVDRLGSEMRMSLGRLNAHVTDTVQGLVEVVAFQREDDRRQELTALSRGLGEARLAFLGDLARQSNLLEATTGLGGLAVALVGAGLASSGELSVGLVPLATLIAMAAFLPISEIAHVGRQLADTFGATRRLDLLEREPATVVDGPERLPPAAPADTPAVAFANVTFSYPGTQRPALADVSFSLRRGSTVALVGPSGAGKTTLAHLLLRFWDPGSGSIRVDGVETRGLRLADLRRQVALVSQDTYLFNGDLALNLRLGRDGATDAELWDALERAALAEFVRSLPDGLETPVGERGLKLSGGQRQRLAIARAVLKDSPVLILDEATSHLDAVSERRVRQAIDDLARGRTTLVIAHRLSTVREAEKIIVLDGGRVREEGRHEELLSRGGLYATLVRRQAEAADPNAAWRGAAAG